MCRLFKSAVNNTRRIEWLDFARGIIMILLIFGHTEISSGVFRVIFSFHVSAFYIMSGYVFSVEKFSSYKEFLKHKIQTLVIPYISFSLINELFLMTCSKVGIIEHPPFFQSVLGIFIQIRGSIYESGLWFLTCLFIIQNIGWVFEKKINSLTLKAGGFLLGCLGCVYVRFVNIPLPWYIDLAAVCFPIFYFGVFLRKTDILCKLPWQSVVVGGIVYVVSMVLNIKYAGGVNIYYGQFGLYPLFYIEGILGSVIILWLCRRYKLQAKAINFVGRESIIFYAVHQPILMAISSFILKPVMKIVELNSAWKLNCYSGVKTLIICLLGVPCVWIIQNKLSWMIGKKR